MSPSSPLDAYEGHQSRAARRPSCSASPHCRTPSRELLVDLGLPAGMPCRWIHIGPIERRRSPIAVHDGPASGVRTFGMVPTWPEHRPYPGFSIDLLALRDRPSLPARPIVVRRDGQGEVLYLVHAVAWRRADGPYAIWQAGPTGPHLAFQFADDNPTAVVIAELQRGADLLLGRAARPGRPTRLADPDTLLLAERAETMKRQRPSLTWGMICRDLAVEPRTLRAYRADLRRERRPGPTGPMLVPGSH